MDEDLEAAMRAGVREGRAPHPAALARATRIMNVQTAADITPKYLAQCVTLGKLTFAKGDLSMASDASRVGNPAVELMVEIIYSHKAMYGFVLPPQELA